MHVSHEQQNGEPTETVTLPKVDIFIQGLDEVLQGGLPVGRTTLVHGGPGCGKTILGLEFLYRRALAGDSGILVALEETIEAVRQNALTLGWNLAPLEQAQQSPGRGLRRDAIALKLMPRGKEDI